MAADPHVTLRGLHTQMGQAGWCDACSKHMPDGPDSCLGTLPGVAHACCGHGGACEPYIVFGDHPNQSAQEIADRVTLRGRAALVYFKRLAVGPPLTLSPSRRGPSGVVRRR